MHVALQRVTNHGYGCCVCDSEVFTLPPHDKNGFYWLPDRAKFRRRHIHTHHPMINEDDLSIFSKTVEPWHENALWAKITNGHSSPVGGVYCKLLEYRQNPKHRWDTPTQWHAHEDHAYHVLEKPKHSQVI
jgi:hypothetical protein